MTANKKFGRASNKKDVTYFNEHDVMKAGTKTKMLTTNRMTGRRGRCYDNKDDSSRNKINNYMNRKEESTAEKNILPCSHWPRNIKDEVIEIFSILRHSQV
jgi:hypothetical protein